MTACLDVLALFEKKILRIVDYRLDLSANIWYNAVNKKNAPPPITSRGDAASDCANSRIREKVMSTSATSPSYMSIVVQD